MGVRNLYHFKHAIQQMDCFAFARNDVNVLPLNILFIGISAANLQTKSV